MYGGWKVAICFSGIRIAEKQILWVFYMNSSPFLLSATRISRLNVLWKCIFCFSTFLLPEKQALLVILMLADKKWPFAFFAFKGPPVKVLVYWTRPNVNHKKGNWPCIFRNERILLDDSCETSTGVFPRVPTDWCMWLVPQHKHSSAIMHCAHFMVPSTSHPLNPTFQPYMEMIFRYLKGEKEMGTFSPPE